MSDPAHEEVLRFVREHKDPAVSTREVSEAFSSVGKRTIYNRLKELRSRGELQKKKVGAKAVVWYVNNYVSDSASARSPSSVNQ